MRETVNAVIIENRKILVVRKKDSWLLPGGKPKEGESDLECLFREFGEELSGTQLENVGLYGDFIGNTHIGERFKTKIYFADVREKLGKPSAEIEEVRWVYSPKGYNFSDMNLKVFDSLIKNGYIGL